MSGDVAGSVGVDFISTEEILGDVRYFMRRYAEAAERADALPTTEDLRREGAEVFARVNAHFPVHYRYSADDLRYADLGEDVGAETTYAGGFGDRTEVRVNSAHAGNAALVDLLLAHEAAHAALRDRSEWLEELVALDVAYSLRDDGWRPGLDRAIYERRSLQAIDALAIKLRKGEGMSEVEVAEYMRSELGFKDGLILEYVDVKVEGGEFRPVRSGSRRSELERASRYYGQPYLVEKSMAREGWRLSLTVGGESFTLALDSLMAHTDDAKKGDAGPSSVPSAEPWPAQG